MRIKVLKQFLWVLNTLFVLAIVAIALRYFLLDGPKFRGSRSAEAILPGLPVGGSVDMGPDILPADSFRVIWDLPIHGLPPVKEVAVDQTAGPGPIPPLARDYELAWTCVDTQDSWRSYAHLKRKSDGRILYAPMGFMVEGVWKVIRVENGIAEFEEEQKGEKVVLEMPKDVNDEMVRPAGDVGGELPGEQDVIGAGRVHTEEEEYRAGPRRQARLVDRASNHWDLGPVESDWWGRHGEKVIEEVSLQQEKDPDTGRPAGVRIRTIPQNSMLEARGLKKDDVIKSINGVPVNSKQEAIAYVKGPGKDATRYVVVIERKGQTMSFTYDVRR